MGKPNINVEKSTQTGTFHRKVNHTVTFLFGINFLGVLLVGGVSVFFARSIYTAADEIRREHQEVETADRIHVIFHHLLFALQRAVILSSPVPRGSLSAYREELDRLLEHEHGYHRASREQKVVDQIRSAGAELFDLSDKIGIKANHGGAAPNRQLLDELENIGSTIQLLAHSLSMSHKARMDRLLEQNKSSIQWIFSFYVAFFLLGAALVVGSNFYFGHTLARPLRWLSRAGEQVARGSVQEKLPVISKDEIGLLSHTFNVMVERLAESEAKLKRLAILEERERIARELHDSVAQSLAFLNLKLAELESAQGKTGALAIERTVSDMRKIVGDAYDDVRQAIFGLRTLLSDNAGLVHSLTEFIHDFSVMRQISIDLRIPNPGAIQFTPQAEVQLIRVIQEALTNVAKHAKAKKSVVSLEQDGDWARIIVEDDGKGFSLDHVKNMGFHFGVKTMRERTEAVGGEFTIESVLGKGTRVIVRLPLESNNGDGPDSNPSC
ncbi:MAG: histidine kinase [Deltaproteobacteria bacterium]|nr:histidine kinase [Deltaproteobacteria bacterium]